MQGIEFYPQYTEDRTDLWIAHTAFYFKDHSFMTLDFVKKTHGPHSFPASSGSFGS